MAAEELLTGLVIGYAVGSAVTWALIRFGASLQASLQARRARTATMPLAFVADGLPKVTQEIRRIVPNEPPSPPDHYTFPLAADDGTTTRETVSARHLARFIGMPQVTREHWRGEKTTYSQLLRIAEAHGWIQRINGRAWDWAPDCRTLGRRVLRLQELGITLPHPGAE